MRVLHLPLTGRQHFNRILPTLVAVAALLAVAALALGPSTAQAAPAYTGSALHSLANENYADMGRELDAARASGANVVRIDINWATLEPLRGRYSGWYLDRIDRFMRGATARDLKVVAMIHKTPCWASSAPSSLKLGCSPGWQERGVPLYPPSNPGTYGAISKIVAARYKGSLAGIEVWNEPNRPGFFRASDPAKAYVPLVKAAYSAVKAAAPNVKVIAGSIAGANAIFLEQLYANGIKGHYDGVSVHPYVADLRLGPDTDWGEKYASYTFLPGLKLIRAAQTTAGDDRPVWLTEFGWHTGSRDLGLRSGVSEETQAEYLARAFELLADPGYGLAFVEGAITYNLRDNSSDPLDPGGSFGLLRRDFSEKPSFDAVRQMISR